MKLYPEWPSPQESLVKVLLVQRKSDEARAQLEQMIGDAPERLSTYLMLGQIYHQEGERALAVETYEKALKQDPEFWLAANDLAFILSEEGASEEELKRASELARQAQRLLRKTPAFSIPSVGFSTARAGGTGIDICPPGFEQSSAEGGAELPSGSDSLRSGTVEPGQRLS